MRLTSVSTPLAGLRHIACTLVLKTLMGAVFQCFAPLSWASSYCLQFQAESLYGRGFQAFRPPSCSSSYWLQLQAETLVGHGYPAFRALAGLRHTGCSCRLKALIGTAFQRFDPLSLASSYCLQFQAETLVGQGFPAFRPPLTGLRHTGCSCRLKALISAVLQRFDPLNRSSSYWLQFQAERFAGRGFPAFRPP